MQLNLIRPPIRHLHPQEKKSGDGNNAFLIPYLLHHVVRNKTEKKRTFENGKTETHIFSTQQQTQPNYKSSLISPSNFPK